MKRLLISLLVMTALMTAGCDEVRPTIRKLDVQGNTWYISDNENYDPSRYVGQTCATLGRTVIQVTLAGEDASEATIRCGKPTG